MAKRHPEHNASHNIVVFYDRSGGNGYYDARSSRDDYRRSAMIDFEEELKKFQPSLEVEEAEDAIYNRDLSDMTDILLEMMRERNN